MVTSGKEIIERLPYGKSFSFVDEIIDINENGVVGTFTYAKDLPFYEGHFKDNPITPAVILTETMAQIGLVCLGLFLLDAKVENRSLAMTSNAVDFFKPVYPGEKVLVKSEKIYFRFKKLSCRVTMYNHQNEIVCKGTISGMFFENSNE
ncbi:3-hydroxyacyl-ACP dehydratase FabZ family protein [Pedobacter sandarakinus]|uniref:3-hydroxyacyl-ACP dehydratase FabZ family protein n=1 Tax=Pedobacter sandarakinus TaxID=353156 RepID=UPI0022457BE1|nr:3-hydroxyacyl-ACP dehydratase FabZ family protein [Pedobacter sandarakinus]MCX2573112.1 beta-hydroxyacyl-ACP dehydratase [Pedobacter sandarakinus]